MHSAAQEFHDGTNCRKMSMRRSGSIRKSTRRHLLAGVALLALSVPAAAQNINTISQWD